jgi:hypothetical protein
MRVSQKRAKASRGGKEKKGQGRLSTSPGQKRRRITASSKATGGAAKSLPDPDGGRLLPRKNLKNGRFTLLHIICRAVNALRRGYGALRSIRGRKNDGWWDRLARSVLKGSRFGQTDPATGRQIKIRNEESRFSNPSLYRSHPCLSYTVVLRCAMSLSSPFTAR